MLPEILSQKRIDVRKESACFVVTVDSKPVLRCLGHRDALRYAVLVRRAFERSGLVPKDGVAVSKSPSSRKIRN